MKPANILLTKHGVLKLGDFGLARDCKIGETNRYTNNVVTLWYRPPGKSFFNMTNEFSDHDIASLKHFHELELLLGDRNYGPPVDMWGTGCIMAELWTRSPIMQGQTEQQQLTFISHLCGSITPNVMNTLLTLC